VTTGVRRTRNRGSNRASSLLANSLALLISRMTVAVLGWAGTVLVVRTLSEDDFGRFNLIFSVLGVLSIVTDLGIGRFALSGMLHPDPRRDRAAFAGGYVLLRCLLGVIGYLTALAFVYFAGYPEDVIRATAVAGGVVVLATPSNAYATIFQAHRRMRGLAVTQAVARLAQLALTAALAVAGGSLLLFTIPAVLAELLMLAWSAPMAHRLMEIRYRVNVTVWWRMLREAAPLSVGTAFATVYYRLDSIMLSKMTGFVAVGAYGVANKFVDLAHFSASAVTTAILPVLVEAWPDQPGVFRAALRRAATVLGLSSGLILVEFTLFAAPLIGMLYGAAYVDSADAARILVASDTFSAITTVSLISLISVGRHRRYPVIALVGLIANVVLNLILIPRFSYLGASVATLVTEAVVSTWLCLELRKVPGLRPLPRPPLVRLLSTVTLTAAIGWALSLFLPWLVAVPIVGGAYLALVVVLRAAGSDGLKGLRHDVTPAAVEPAPEHNPV
jgi:O-antigen/teichoic acid export membrane protein